MTYLDDLADEDGHPVGPGHHPVIPGVDGFVVRDAVLSASGPYAPSREPGLLRPPPGHPEFALGAEAAVERHRYQGSGSFEGTAFTDDQRGVMIWEKQAGTWRLVFEQCSFYNK